MLWKLDRESFNAIVKDAAQKKRERYEGFLARVPLLKGMDSYQRSQISDGLQSEKVITQGDDGEIICEHSVSDLEYIVHSVSDLEMWSPCVMKMTTV